MKAKDILKTAGIISLDENAPLSEAIPKFKSSHDAIMVIDQDQFLGLVNPYQVMVKRTYPPKTKLKNCLFSPPKLNLNTELLEIARLMLESKVHYLPVLNDASQLLGIVTARRLLRSQLNNPRANLPVAKLVEDKPYLRSINLDSSFDELLRFFQRTKLSKIVVVNRNHNLQGIISLFDILPLFEESKERKPFFDRGETTNRLTKYTLKHFLKTATIKVNPTEKVKTAIRLILDKEIGSVIVMKNRLQPENIITTSDLLKFLFYGKEEHS